MLWSLIRILVFIAVVAALATIASYLMETEGSIRLSVAGTEFNLGPLQAAIAMIAIAVVIWLLLKVASLLVAVSRFLNGDETAVSRYFDRNRERRGFRALSEGLLALASGEGRVAMSKAARAERLLRKPDLTNLLAAQAAEMAGDRAKAEAAYRKLLYDGATRFAGVRGIMKQRLADGDIETAMKLAEKAFALKPQHEETQDILLQLQAKKSDWKGARKTLAAKLSTGTMPRDMHRRRDAVLALSEAAALLEDGAPISERIEAIEANRLSPDLIPAAAMAARSYISQGKLRRAARILKKAWSSQPYPDLAAACAEIAPDETPEKRLKRFGALTKLKPDHAETRMLLAELHIANEDFPAARKAIGDLATSEPTIRALAIMAAVERGEGSEDDVVRGWLARALTAPRGPQWICGNCKAIHTAWAPVCPYCSGFDTFAWQDPEVEEEAMPGSAEMLPLIVGAGPDAAEEEEAGGDAAETPAEGAEMPTSGEAGKT